MTDLEYLELTSSPTTPVGTTVPTYPTGAPPEYTTESQYSQPIQEPQPMTDKEYLDLMGGGSTYSEPYPTEEEPLTEPIPKPRAFEPENPEETEYDVQNFTDTDLSSLPYRALSGQESLPAGHPAEQELKEALDRMGKQQELDEKSYDLWDRMQDEDKIGIIETMKNKPVSEYLPTAIGALGGGVVGGFFGGPPGAAAGVKYGGLAGEAVSGGIAIAHTLGIKFAIDRLKSTDYSEFGSDYEQGIKKKQDEQLLENYFNQINMLEERGKTIPALIASGAMALPGYMIMFAGTGGVANLASASARKAGKKALGSWAKKAVAKNVLRGIGTNPETFIKLLKAAPTAGKAAMLAGRIPGLTIRAAARMAASPWFPGEELAQRSLPRNATITDEGLKIISPADSWGTTIWKTAGSSLAELAAEETGEILTMPIAAAGRSILKASPVARKVMEKLHNALKGEWLKGHPGYKAAQFSKNMLSEGGYSGMLGEIGEERLTDMLNAIAGIEPVGAAPIGSERGMSRLEAMGRSLFPGVENMLVEIGVLSIPMLAGQAANVPARAYYGHKRAQRLEFLKQFRAKTPIEDRQGANALEHLLKGENEKAAAVAENMPEGQGKEAIMGLAITPPAYALDGSPDGMTYDEIEDVTNRRIKEIVEKPEPTPSEGHEMNILIGKDYEAIADMYGVKLDWDRIAEEQIRLSEEEERAEREPAAKANAKEIMRPLRREENERIRRERREAEISVPSEPTELEKYIKNPNSPEALRHLVEQLSLSGNEVAKIPKVRRIELLQAESDGIATEWEVEAPKAPKTTTTEPPAPAGVATGAEAIPTPSIKLEPSLEAERKKIEQREEAREKKVKEKDSRTLPTDTLLRQSAAWDNASKKVNLEQFPDTDAGQAERSYHIGLLRLIYYRLVAKDQRQKGRERSADEWDKEVKRQEEQVKVDLQWYILEKAIETGESFPDELIRDTPGEVKRMPARGYFKGKDGIWRKEVTPSKTTETATRVAPAAAGVTTGAKPAPAPIKKEVTPPKPKITTPAPKSVVVETTKAWKDINTQKMGTISYLGGKSDPNYGIKLDTEDAQIVKTENEDYRIFDNKKQILAEIGTRKTAKSIAEKILSAENVGKPIAERVASLSNAELSELAIAVQADIESGKRGFSDFERAVAKRAGIEIEAKAVKPAPKPEVEKKAVPKPEPKPEVEKPKSKLGTIADMDTVALSREFEPYVDGAIKDNRALKKMVATFYGVSVPVMEQTAGYNFKKVQEAYELALTRVAHSIVVKNTGNIADTLTALQKLYDNQVVLNERTSKSMIQQGYSTPAPYAYLVGMLAGADKASNMADTSAGNAMLEIARGTKTKVIVGETDPVRVAALRDQGLSVNVKDADIEWLEPKSQDSIVLNPPFGRVAEQEFDGYKISKREHIQVIQALKAMKDDGRAAFIIGGNMFAGQPISSNDRIFFNWVYNHYNVTANLDMTGSLYRKMGTGWNTRLIVINGRKETPEGHAPLDAISTKFDKGLDDVRAIAEETAPVAEVAKPEAKAEPLAVEARKYKTAKEFVEAQGEVLYHGSSNKFKAEDIDFAQGNLREGIYLSGSKSVANDYGKNIHEYKISPSAKVLDLSDGESTLNYILKNEILEKDDIDVDLENYILNGQIFQYDPYNRIGIVDDIMVAAKSDGYDVVKFLDDLGGESDNIATIVVNKDVIKTDADLTALWNEAQPAPAKAEPVKTGVVEKEAFSEELIAEAKKYKSVEEFVQKTHAKFFKKQDTKTESERKLSDEFYKSDKEAVWNESQAEPTEVDEPAEAPVVPPVAPSVKSDVDNILDDIASDFDEAEGKFRPEGELFPAEAPAIDPKLIVKMVKAGKMLTEQGITDFTDWSKIFYDKIGDRVLPYVVNVYNQTRKRASAEIKSKMDSPLVTIKLTQDDILKLIIGEEEVGEKITGGREVVAEREKKKTVVEASEAKKKSVKESGQTYRIPYEPTSKCKRAGSLIPFSLRGLIDKSLKKIQKAHPDMDAWVAEEIGVDPAHMENFHEAFFAEQVDAIAQLFYNWDKDTREGHICGFQTGTGKTWVAAASIYRAIRKGKKPVFITQKPELFSDLYKTFYMLNESLGLPVPNPYIVNDGIDIMDPRTGGTSVLFPKKTAGEKTIFKNNYTSGTAASFMEDKNIILLTYPQVSSGKSEMQRAKKAFVQIAANDGAIILDEAHKAAGPESNTGQVLRNILFPPEDVHSLRAEYVSYLTATYAKNPRMMGLYNRTILGQGRVGQRELEDLLEQGGVPMEEWIAEEIARAGQLHRVEQDFQNVKFGMIPIDEDLPIEERLANENKVERDANEISSGILNLWKFDEELMPLRDELAEYLKKKYGGSWPKAFRKKFKLAKAGFGNIAHNFIRQFLFAVKAQPAIRETIKQLKLDANGRPTQKVILTSENTMESVLKYLGAGSIGGECPDNFLTSLKRGLKTILHYTWKDDKGNTREGNITPEDMKAMGYEKMADRMAGIIEHFDKTIVDVPLSPLDVVREALEERGINVAEATGRSIKLVDGVFTKRTKEEKNIRQICDQFNAGNIDVILGNSVISGGFSLHAGKEFKDQRKRVMIAMQTHQDIVVQVQMNGRVKRYGEVIAPELGVLASKLPSETRPNAIYMKKMASLHAATTAKGVSGYDIDIPDIMNHVGDKVMYDFFSTDRGRELGDRIFVKYDHGILKHDINGFARWVTGRMAMLPIEDQREIYAYIIPTFNAKIEELNARNENDLVSTHLELKAKKISEVVADAGDNTNGLTDGYYTGTYKVLNPKRPLESAKITDLVRQNSGAVERILKVIEEKAIPWARAYSIDAGKPRKITVETKVEARKRVENEKSVSKRIASIQDTINLLKRLKIGQEYTFLHENWENESILVNVKTKEDAKNPAARHYIELQFAVPDGRKLTSLPLTKIESFEYPKSEEEGDKSTAQVLSLWDEHRGEEYVNRQIITGNLLSGLKYMVGLNIRSKVITFTMEDGEIRRGILIPEKVTIEEAKTIGVSKTLLIQLLGKKSLTWFQSGAVEVFIKDRLDLRVPAGKGIGELIKDKPLLDLIESPDGFRKNYRTYVAYTGKDNLRAIVDYLDNRYRNFKVARTEIPPEFLKAESSDITTPLLLAREVPHSLHQAIQNTGAKPDVPSQATHIKMDARDVAGAVTDFRIEMPELVHICKELLGKYPRIREQLRVKLKGGGKASAYGSFNSKTGSIDLMAAIFKDPDLASKVFAHELGHMDDWLPHLRMDRGNILGRIASFIHYNIHQLPTFPENLDQSTKITQDERNTLRRAAENEAKSMLGKGASKTAIAKIRREIYQNKLSELASEKNVFTLDEIREELINVTRQWSPWDESQSSPSYNKYRRSSVELYAEAMSVFFNAPEKLQRWAPKFYAAMKNYRVNTPVVKKLYEQIQDDIKSGKINDVRLKSIYEMQEKGPEARKEAEKAQMETKADVVRGFVQGLIDRNAPLTKRLKYAKKEGKIWDWGADPLEAIRDIMYMNDLVQTYVKENNNLNRFLEENDLTGIDFATYGFLKRTIEERKEFANPLGFGGDPSIKTLEALEAKIGPKRMEKLEEARQKFFEIREEYVIPRLLKSEAYTKELMDQVQDNDNYFTFSVLKFMEARGGKGGGHIYHQVGTLEDINNVWDATVMNDISLIRAAIVTEAKLKIIRWMAPDTLIDGGLGFAADDIEEAKYYMRDTGKKDKKGEPIKFKQYDEKDAPLKKGLMVISHQGTSKGYYIPKTLADLYKKDPILGSLFFRGLASATVPFKSLYTGRNWAWMVWNVQRDFRAFVKQIPGMNPWKAAKYYWRAVHMSYMDIVKGVASPELKTMHKHLMFVVGFGESGGWEMGDPETEVEHLARKWQVQDLADTHKKIFPMLRELWNAIETPGQLAERIPKVAAYLYLTQETDKPMTEIAHLVRKRAGSPDFKDGGAWRQIYNNILIFSNPALVGWQAGWEAAKEDPWDYAIKTFYLDILPKLIMLGALWGLLGDEMKKLFEKIPDYDLARRICIPLGLTKGDEAVYMIMPHGFIGETFAGMLWHTGKAIEKKDLKKLLEFMEGTNPYSSLNPLIQLVIDTSAFALGRNPVDNWRGQEIIDARVMKQGLWYENPDACREFLKHQWNSAGLSLFYRFQGERIKPIRSEVANIMGTPHFPGRWASRLIRVSKRGERERYTEAPEIIQAEKIRARQGVDMLKIIENTIKELGDKPTKWQIKRGADKAWREAKKSGSVPEDYKQGYFTARYNRLAEYRFGTERARATRRMTKSQRKIVEEKYGRE